MNTWYTADTHFFHINIIRHCCRPFASVGEMNAALIERWNERVASVDVVYVLGDFAWGVGRKRLEDLVMTLKGRIRLVPGNHDRKIARMLRGGFIDVSESLVIGTDVVLCHYPLASWPRMRHGTLMLHGHCHGTLPPRDRRVDVGVDSWDFRPVSIDEIENKENA